MSYSSGDSDAPEETGEHWRAIADRSTTYVGTYGMYVTRSTHTRWRCGIADVSIRTDLRSSYIDDGHAASVILLQSSSPGIAGRCPLCLSLGRAAAAACPIAHPASRDGLLCGDQPP